MDYNAIDASHGQLRNADGVTTPSPAYLGAQKIVGKTSIAWFKLADVLARGEKERTLTICRLFAHSIQHAAIIAQLEGDILSAFNDVQAVHAYTRAAELYQKNGEYMFAACAYEMIVQILPQQAEHRQKLTELYEMSRCKKKLTVLNT